MRDARLTALARHMRKNPTYGEDRVWQAVRNRRMLGEKFDRQAAVGPFIVDFLCSRLRLVVELDGSGHERQVEYDLQRKAFLEGLSYTVLRIGSEVKLSDGDELIPTILETVRALQVTNPPT